MVVFPNGKINIGLQITQKRTDGYHNLQSVFYPVQIRDVLEIIPSNDGIQELAFSQSGIAIAGSSDNNLCIKAYHLLKNDFPELPPVQMHLHKTIPMGAGLGGGSADGAFVLKLLNDKFQLNISLERLIDYALKLGSDCPFFILNQPCYATGRGEKLSPLSLDLSGYKILIVNPGIHINTGWAFSQLTPKVSNIDLREAILNPVEDWMHNIINDFEIAAIKHYPEIGNIKSHLYEQGAAYASMSGSGSTVYGIFERDANPTLKIPESYFMKWV